MPSPRLSLASLALLCRRLAASYSAGIDPQKTWRREAAQARGAAAARLGELAADLGHGEALEDALEKTRPLYPDSFYELVAVGEESGTTPMVLEHLAVHYEQLLAMRRTFLQRIAWPLIQLAGALSVISLFILILGAIPDAPDPLGWGTGPAGLARFYTAIAALLGFGYAAWLLFRRGAIPRGPIHRFVIAVPYAGPALRTLAVASVASALELTLASGMEIRRAVDLALRAGRLVQFSDAAPQVRARLTAGDELHAALAEHAIFPQDFLDAVAVGEEAGRLPEQMTVVARIYRERAYAALSVLAQVAAFLVWGAVAALIVIGFIIPLVHMIIQPYREAFDFLNESQGG